MTSAYGYFKSEVDKTTRNTTSARRCYLCIETKCLKDRITDYIHKGGKKPPSGK